MLLQTRLISVYHWMNWDFTTFATRPLKLGKINAIISLFHNDSLGVFFANLFDRDSSPIPILWAIKMIRVNVSLIRHRPVDIFTTSITI